MIRSQDSKGAANFLGIIIFLGRLPVITRHSEIQCLDHCRQRTHIPFHEGDAFFLANLVIFEPNGCNQLPKIKRIMPLNQICSHTVFLDMRMVLNFL